MSTATRTKRVYCLCCYPCLYCTGQREAEGNRYCEDCQKEGHEGQLNNEQGQE